MLLRHLILAKCLEAMSMLFRKVLMVLSPLPCLLVPSVYSSNLHAVKREAEGVPGDLASLENERQIYKSVLEGGDIPLQGLSGLKRPSSSASTKGSYRGEAHRPLSPTAPVT